MNILYQDSLVRLTDREIIFHRYYFPFGNDRRVPLTKIASIESGPPSVMTGSWRIWGTGDFVTWFPLDGGRPGRDRIFIANLRDSSRRIGFSVYDSGKLQGALKELGLIAGQTPQRKIGSTAQIAVPSRRPGKLLPVIFLILLMAGYAGLVAVCAPLLPERVAVHFGAGGQADNWTGRHQAIVFFEIMTSLPAVFLLLSVLTGILPTGAMNFPNREEWLAPDQRERTLAWISRQIAWLGCWNVFFVSGIFWLTIRANEKQPPRLPLDFFLPFLGVYTAVIIAWALRFFRHFAKRPASSV